MLLLAGAIEPSLMVTPKPRPSTSSIVVFLWSSGPLRVTVYTAWKPLVTVASTVAAATTTLITSTPLIVPMMVLAVSVFHRTVTPLEVTAAAGLVRLKVKSPATLSTSVNLIRPVATTASVVSTGPELSEGNPPGRPSSETEAEVIDVMTGGCGGPSSVIVSVVLEVSPSASLIV